MLGFVEAIKKVVVENYCNFKGRARRSEYWWFCLASSIVGGLLIIPMYAKMFAAIAQGGSAQDVAAATTGAYSILPRLFGLALLLPSIGVGVRRLHDIGKSGWFYLLGLVPCVNIVLLVWFCTDSQKGPNQWGESPKYPGGSQPQQGEIPPAPPQMQ